MESIKRFEPLFGEWYAIERIGEGSFGKVYKVCKEELEWLEMSNLGLTDPCFRS